MKTTLSVAPWGFAFAAALCALPASAAPVVQNPRSWVAPSGSDTNACSQASPCQTFSGALPNTAPGGDINCLAPGEYGNGSTLTITKSVTINCAGVLAGIDAPSGGPAINVNGSGIIVNLRNLVINGVGAGTDGVDVANAKTVGLDNVTIQGFTNRAIFDNSVSATSLAITNSFIIQNAGPGVVMDAATGSGALLRNTYASQNKYGLGVASGNAATVQESRLDINATSGVLVTSGGAVNLVNAGVAGNSIGIDNLGGSVTIDSSDIVGNTTGISGPTYSFGNNRIFGNTSPGTTPSPIGLE